jgi:CRISPR-associated protein Cas2
MRVLVGYDIATPDSAGSRRLRMVAKACEDFGSRVQYSLFECDLSPADWVRLRARLLKLMKPDQDSLRFYFLCVQDVAKTEKHGVDSAIDLTGPLVL